MRLTALVIDSDTLGSLNIVTCEFLRSTRRIADLSLQELSQILRVICPNADDTVVQINDHTVPARQIPNPSTPNAQMNSPPVQQQRPPCLDLADVLVPYPLAKQGQWAETNEQMVASVRDGQVLKGGCQHQHDQPSHQEYGCGNLLLLEQRPTHDNHENADCVQKQKSKSLLGVVVH
jgi:hypothetical protein